MPWLVGSLANSSVLLGAPAENSNEELSMTVACLLGYWENPTSSTPLSLLTTLS